MGSACQEQDQSEALLPRSERFGIFRDLVLFDRSPEQGGPFFLDRFETTRADFAVFEASLAPEVEQTATVAEALDEMAGRHPVTGVSLHRARSYARWRFCRIPRRDEWMHACTGGGRNTYPWGDSWEDTWANTEVLGLMRTTPVGTFESGRDSFGPYEMIGNVSEWTETVVVVERGVLVTELPIVHNWERTGLDVVGLYHVPDLDRSQVPVGLRVFALDWQPYPRAWVARRIPQMPWGLRLLLPPWQPYPRTWLEAGGFLVPTLVDHQVLEMPGVAVLRDNLGLACWLQDWQPAPTDWLVAADSKELARLVLGGSYRSRVEVPGRSFPRGLPRQAGRWGDSTGIRLCTDPESLLSALLAHAKPVQPADQACLQRFLRRGEHLEVLRQVWPWVKRRRGERGVLFELLEQELTSG